jgi:hypothetical protein
MSTGRFMCPGCGVPLPQLPAGHVLFLGDSGVAICSGGGQAEVPAV